MSTQTRIDIATAVRLAGVPGVNVNEFYVPSTKAGTAFVRRDRTEYPNPFGGIDHWQFVVILPQDMGAAERLLEDIQEPLRTALSEELVVTSATPQRMEFPDVGVLPVVIFNGHREAD